MAELLDPRELWRTQPMEEFKTFLMSPDFFKSGRRRPSPRKKTDDGKDYPIRKSSVEVYASMFGKFLQWTQDRGISLLEVTGQDLLAFLDERMNSKKRGSAKDLNSTIRTRYIRLLERVYARIGVSPNPARHTALEVQRTPGASGKDLPSVALTDAQLEAFMASLPGDRYGHTHWKRRRDRAMLAMLAGAGLTVGEVIGLYMENIGEKDATGAIPISVSPASTDGTSMPHKTFLQPFAVEVVDAWLKEREELKIPKNLVFPGDLKGETSPSKATLYRHAQKTFERAGIPVARKGGRTLRNSFAVRELRNGASEKDVMGYLGLQEEKSIEIYIAAAKKVSGFSR
ncbi:MAG TPA: site-specific integrase [Noviherbaspirillum sp.]